MPKNAPPWPLGGPLALSDLSAKRRTETVALELARVLHEITEPQPTREIVDRIAARLQATSKADKKTIGFLLAKWAPTIPEAMRGGTFVLYGNTAQRWIWNPKGQLPGGAPTRQATRDALAWGGRVYESTEELNAAKAAAEWEV